MLSDAIPHLPPELRHERVTTILMLVSDALALRARQIDLGRTLHVSTDSFVTNLVDMAVGALQATDSHSAA